MSGKWRFTLSARASAALAAADGGEGGNWRRCRHGHGAGCTMPSSAVWRLVHWAACDGASPCPRGYQRPWPPLTGVRVEIGADAAMAKARAARCHPLPCGGWFVRQPAGYAIRPLMSAPVSPSAGCQPSGKGARRGNRVFINPMMWPFAFVFQMAQAQKKPAIIAQCCSDKHFFD